MFAHAAPGGTSHGRYAAPSMGTRTRLRGWRKIAAATWRRPTDPQIYGDVVVDAGAIVDFIAQTREDTGVRLTVTHLVGKALAHAFAENPDLNGFQRRGSFTRRDQVDIFFIVSADGGTELSGVKVEHADRKSVVAIAEELASRAERIRAGRDEEFGRTKNLLATVPPRPLGAMLRLAAWLAVDRNLDLPALGVRRHAFGSAMVSSVGMFGIHRAYAPLASYYRVPFLVLVGEVQPRPAVREGQVVARPTLELNATLDHRYLDGFHASRLARSLQAYLADPAAFEPPAGA
jgi:pyruvate/2-oxoglutarate dehydrogenase complex dihydrolipoamide acyltransferase (E2) component